MRRTTSSPSSSGLWLFWPALTSLDRQRVFPFGCFQVHVSMYLLTYDAHSSSLKFELRSLSSIFLLLALGTAVTLIIPPSPQASKSNARRDTILWRTWIATPRKNGESADGLAVKQGFGEGNVVRGSRLRNNVDGGVDFIEFSSLVTVETTYTWGNGLSHWGFELWGKRQRLRTSRGSANGTSSSGPTTSISWNPRRTSSRAAWPSKTRRAGSWTIGSPGTWSSRATRPGTTRALGCTSNPWNTVTLMSNNAVSNGIDTSLTDEVR
ncbi:uncharacterized protein SCHCODRAFT_02614905 [Schizophyllum commune H4-8]|uniref:uncharacterized protein n=1 Tax=Schizophyllum commune (strain H4-8 / FGSC 9210) TaxID=578458 RepID=UPI00215E0B06|nr:uncharacterized protein SCHCODRAFT_02614905 [Schizophyllum commune H4-8]KAI5896457.1 hypothetical protein SCHCODRAFT_02614905 [Schizophyllum commune H4-8]